MTTAEDTEPEVTDVYTDAGEWFDHWLAPALADGKWQGGGKGKLVCPQWYRHRMVALRVDALWQEWEKANREGAMSSWWVYHFDAHARAIFDGETGPMYLCSPDKHHETPDPLTPRPVPPGWFDQSGTGGPDFRVLTN
ncbi:DUF4913 domain-containing protein [Nocardia terpenica]|uniref:DUF4913 domain-containing protein n=1 Tax=Nocardia terpenica TaxID=455432 RepID=UPI0012FE16FB|nr:DUF4913 domain-containing protein [Nocardia terpenica]